MRAGSGGRTPLTVQPLRELHIDQGLNARQIAEELGYRGLSGRPSTERVRGALAHYGISIPRAQQAVSDRPSLRQVKQPVEEEGIVPRS